MLLARRGYKVVVVDRAVFPSDSAKGHFIRSEGIAQLCRWGLLAKLQASDCPPVQKMTVDMGDFPLTGYRPRRDGNAEFGPRRYVLDKILVDAAVEAGAELRDGFSVLELVTDGDRVTGIRGRSRHGTTVTERAPIVIGADGHHSMVAKTMGAASYNERPVLTCGYWSYWSGVHCDGMEMYLRDRPALLLAFPTNNGLTCVATQVPVANFQAFRSNIHDSFFSTLELVPDLAERVRAGNQEERFRGTADLSNFFRKPYGPGWALVGDAGYHKDPFTALGISDAFRDAELLAEAIDDGFSGRKPLDCALSHYEYKRNEAAIPGYEMTYAMASFTPMPQDLFRLRALARGDQAATDRLIFGG
jgi:flavin-dependent dehydrogenase